MNTNSAQRMMLAAQDSSIAFGPHNLQPTIAGHKCTVIEYPVNHVTVIDDREVFHDFIGKTWSEIRESMLDYFAAVDNGR